MQAETCTHEEGGLIRNSTDASLNMAFDALRPYLVSCTSDASAEYTRNAGGGPFLHSLPVPHASTASSETFEQLVPDVFSKQTFILLVF
jgi:hypothetical protein